MRCRRAHEIESGNDISLSEQDTCSGASGLVYEKKDACSGVQDLVSST